MAAVRLFWNTNEAENYKKTFIEKRRK